MLTFLKILRHFDLSFVHACRVPSINLQTSMEKMLRLRSCIVMVVLIILLCCRYKTFAVEEHGDNPCPISHINVTDETVEIAPPQNSSCFVDVTSTDEGKTISYTVLNPGVNSVYSYLYIEHEQTAVSDYSCSYSKYLLVSLKQSCTGGYIVTRSARLVFINNQVNLQIQSVPAAEILPNCNVPPSSSVGFNDNSYRQCNTTPINAVDEGRRNRYVSFGIVCRVNCSCVLDYRQWKSVCGNDSHESITLLLYSRSNKKLYFIRNGIDIITENAFSGLEWVLELRLSYNNISELKADVFRDQIRLNKIDIQGNILTLLPNGLFRNQGRLKLLYLGNNRLTTLSFKWFEKLTNLVIFQCAYNRISTLTPGFFNGLSKLQTIDITFNSISILPDDLFKDQTRLQGLKLNGNSIERLPVGMFFHLYQLRELVISHNRISSLAKSTFGSLRNLLYLALNNNSLSTIHTDVFAGLGSVRVIDLSFNNVLVISENVFVDTPNLTTIVLNYNNISHIPEGLFSNATRLKMIDLSYNQLQVLRPGTFYKLYELYSLYIDNNNLTVLPVGIFDSQFTLEILWLSYNKLTHLPCNIFQALSLVFLNLEHNRLNTLPLGLFDSTRNLIELWLNNNRLTMIPRNTFDSLPCLEILLLHSNNISSFTIASSHTIKMNDLQLHNNQLKELSGGVFGSMYDLYNLRLDNNKIFTLSNGLFTNLSNLVQLNLSSNCLYTLSVHDFSNLTWLGYLDLGYNALTVLPDTIFDSMRSLQALIIKQNNLATLSGRLFISFFNLITLDVSGNEIDVVTIHNAAGTSLSYLNSLRMSDNRLSTISFSVYLADIKILDLGHNQVTTVSPGIFNSLSLLTILILRNNQIMKLPNYIFNNQSNLEVLDLRYNLLSEISIGLFQNLTELLVLKLSGNRLSYLNMAALKSNVKLQTLEAQQNRIVSIFDDLIADSSMKSLQFVNLSHNYIQHIEQYSFISTTGLITIDLRHNDLLLASVASFAELSNSTTLLVDNSATCCFARNSHCVSTYHRPPYLTCARMLNDMLLRVSMWILGASAVLCNGIVFYLRWTDIKSSTIQTVLITHLSISDGLMGINMILLASVDRYYADYFPSFAAAWQAGPLCKIAGMLSILSSEVSVFLITLIAFDRFVGIKYPFSAKRLRSKSASISLVLIWLTGLLISISPLLLSEVYDDFYEVSEVCVGIPMARRPITLTETLSVQIRKTDYEVEFFTRIDFRTHLPYLITSVKSIENIENIPYTINDKITGYKLATYFSIIVFIGVNTLCFLTIVFMYVQIFVANRSSARSSGRNQLLEEEFRLARKMFVIIFTDFCCWVPLIATCILVQCGIIKVHPVAYAWIVAFILPINSALNPFLYTLTTFICGKN